MESLTYTDVDGNVKTVTFAPKDESLDEMAIAAELLPNINYKDGVILYLLLQQEEMYGLEIIKKGEGKITKNEVYVLLNRLVKKGLLESRTQENAPGSGKGPDRIMYRIKDVYKPMIQLWFLYKKLMGTLIADPK
ncbi:MAG: hypothetical protein UT33_C0010G0051 [Candidatus Peregrinibacteria bacterium GW2011_GWC2_39_14]|nr:MAG: hypothetical protein US92_C0006G0051 [Candidatus Peregrinibacteria bacterium GW2011_GWA2_38_36]KKR05908.1 MAG: hypothetical protein UT33_C0010G0051 [Candidatus Peregrinibacteria bacterium GW2011_GWC2_39_14]